MLRNSRLQSGGNKLNPRLHEAGDEMDVAGQPVKLGDHKRGLLASTEFDGFEQLGPVAVPLAGFDLGELGMQGTGSQETGDGLPRAWSPRPLSPWRSVETRW